MHEPPLLSLVAEDPEIQPQLMAVATSVGSVLERLERGDMAGAARQFVEEIAFEPGAWEQLPPPLRETMIDSAPAFLAEQTDPLWAVVDPTALAGIPGPVLLSQGDQSPDWFRQIVGRLARAIEGAEVFTYRGAGHAPHLTNPDDYLTTVTSFLSREMVGA